jgi:prolactin regulatory element-binding protein
VLYILLNSKARKASYLGIYIHKKTWEYSTHIRLARKPMTAYAVNQSQDLIAFACSDLSLYIYRLDKLTCIKRFSNVHGFPVTCLDFNRDSTILASGSADGTISLSEIPKKGENSHLFLGKSYFLLLTSIVLALFFALILFNEAE